MPRPAPADERPAPAPAAPPRKPRGRPKGSNGPTHYAVLRLFDAGHPPARVAEELGVSLRRVQQVLQAAGRAAATGPAARAERFAALWNAAADLAAAAAALGRTPSGAASAASRLRRRGVPLKRMPTPRGPKPGVKARRIEELHGRGWEPTVIAREAGTTRAYVYDVLYDLRRRERRPPGP